MAMLYQLQQKTSTGVMELVSSTLKQCCIGVNATSLLHQHRYDQAFS